MASDADAENDDDDRHNIGHDMSDQGSHASVASRLCRQKVIILLNSDHGASDDSGTADASANPQDQDDLGNPGPTMDMIVSNRISPGKTIQAWRRVVLRCRSYFLVPFILSLTRHSF